MTRKRLAALVILFAVVFMALLWWVIERFKNPAETNTEPTAAILTPIVSVSLPCGSPPKLRTVEAEIVSIVPEEAPQEKPVEIVVEPELPYTEADITMMAKLLYRECRGVKSKAEQAAVAWCVLNRVDAKKYPDTIKDVITQKSQFAWNSKTPVTDELYELAEDVLGRWAREKNGETDVGRTLPATYLYFRGDGKRNHFRETFESTKTWGWTLPDPYKEG